MTKRQVAIKKLLREVKKLLRDGEFVHVEKNVKAIGRSPV